jgi:hypothetical protein
MIKDVITPYAGVLPLHWLWTLNNFAVFEGEVRILVRTFTLVLFFLVPEKFICDPCKLVGVRPKECVVSAIDNN